MGHPSSHFNTQCHLSTNISPGATDTMVEISPHLSTMLHTSPAGPALAHKLLYLCLKHYRSDLGAIGDLPSRWELIKFWPMNVTVSLSLLVFHNIFISHCYPSLASTTVTGIPMKEEQNASSSANYDVELFHHGESHARLLGITPPITMACLTAKTSWSIDSLFNLAGDVSDMTLARRGGCEYNTATLKWCTPR